MIASLARYAAAIVAFAAVGSCAHAPPPAPLVVTIAAFNDFHGHLEPPRAGVVVTDGGIERELPTGGVAYVSSLLTRIRASNPQHVTVAAGDLIGGSPLRSALFYDEPTIEALNHVGLEFASVGNHEFDRGLAELLRMQRGGCAAPDSRRQSCRHGAFTGAEFQYLAANVIDERSGRLILPPYAVKQFEAGGGRKISIAFVGVVLKDTPSVVMPQGIAGLRFGDEASAVNTLIPELRAKGVEAIVVLIHEGGETRDASFDDANCTDFTGPIIRIAERLDPAVDLIVSGHTHRAYICRHAGRLITSAGSEGRIVTQIDMRIDPHSRDVIDLAARQHAVVNGKDTTPDAQLVDLIERDTALFASLAGRKVTRIVTPITREQNRAGESMLGKLVADAQLAATREAGAQIAFMNRGGLRSDLRAAAGEVTFNDLFAVHPFGNGLVTMTLTGEELGRVLEQQWPRPNSILFVSEGFTYEWDASQPIGSRIVPGTIQLHGAALDPTRDYRVTVNEFLAAGGDGFATLVQGRDRVRGPVDVDALERYASQHDLLAAPQSARVRRRD